MITQAAEHVLNRICIYKSYYISVEEKHFSKFLNQGTIKELSKRTRRIQQSRRACLLDACRLPQHDSPRRPQRASMLSCRSIKAQRLVPLVQRSFEWQKTAFHITSCQGDQLSNVIDKIKACLWCIILRTAVAAVVQIKHTNGHAGQQL